MHGIYMYNTCTFPTFIYTHVSGMFLFLQPRNSNPPELPQQSFHDLMISKVQISYPQYEGNESENHRAILRIEVKKMGRDVDFFVLHFTIRDSGCESKKDMFGVKNMIFLLSCTILAGIQIHVPGKPITLFLRQSLLVLGVKLPLKIGHLAFQVVVLDGISVILPRGLAYGLR